MKKALSLLLTLALLLTCVSPVFAADKETTSAADNLYKLGLFKGKGTNADGAPIYDLDNDLTRSEAVTMLVKLLGKEEEAVKGSWETPFTDVAAWAEPFVGYAYANKFTSGTGATTFGANNLIPATQYLTFILRALGYENGTDFQWDSAWTLTDRLGITNGQYPNKEPFHRGDVVKISWNALNTSLKDSSETLAQKLIKEGAFTQAQFDALMAVPSAPNTGNAWTGNVGTSFAGGKGTESDPYHIATAEQLAYLAKQVNAGNRYSDKYFILDSDLDLGKIEWTPIGNFDNSFDGIFDGNNHTIRNLSITKADLFRLADYDDNEWHDSTECIGLFGRNTGTVMNLTVDGDIHIDKPDAPDRDDVLAGGVVGFNNGPIKNCHSHCNVYVSVPSKDTYVNVGGVAGVFSWKGNLVDGCSNTGTVYGHSAGVTRCGGIAGDCDGYGALINCWNSGDVTSTITADGIEAGAGGMYCHSWSAVTANCCNWGKITADRTGGIIGYTNGQAEDGEGPIANCWSADAVNSTNSRGCGYITGRHFYGNINTCYGIGSSDLKIAGYVDDASTVENTSILTPGQMKELCDKLNEWVAANNSGDYHYYNWSVLPGTNYPVPQKKAAIAIKQKRKRMSACTAFILF